MHRKLGHIYKNEKPIPNVFPRALSRYLSEMAQDNLLVHRSNVAVNVGSL
jgi:hypothetical protein